MILKQRPFLQTGRAMASATGPSYLQTPLFRRACEFGQGRSQAWVPLVSFEPFPMNLKSNQANRRLPYTPIASAKPLAYIARTDIRAKSAFGPDCGPITVASSSSGRTSCVLSAALRRWQAPDAERPCHVDALPVHCSTVAGQLLEPSWYYSPYVQW